MAEKIRRVVGAEPKRDNEYPGFYWVGFPKGTIHSVHTIEAVEQNMGSYSIVWFVARREDGSAIGKMNALHVAEVEYYPPEKADG